MSYVTYTTEALVCGSFDQNTSDRSFLLFTRDAGMLYATARSVREEVSKQRHALQDFSRIRVSLIKGKQGWRVGSVEAEHNDFSAAVDREVRGSVVLIYRLLRRYIRGEEAYSDLYDFTIHALEAIAQTQPNRRLLDLYIQTHILSMLGYVDQGSIPEILQTKSLAEIASLEVDFPLEKLENIAKKAAESSHL